MKKQIITLAMALLTFGAFAQEETQSDTTTINMGNKTILIIENDYKDSDTTKTNITDTINSTVCVGCSDDDLTHWGGIDLGIKFLMNPDNSIPKSGDSTWLDLDYGHSFSWNFNLIEKKIKIVDNYVGLITGLGFSYNSYGLQNKINISTQYNTYDTLGNVASTVDSTMFSQSTGTIEYSKNKLRTSSLRIPLLLEFNTNNVDNDKSFHVAGGVIGGWTFRTMHRTDYTENGIEYKNKSKGEFNTNKFTLDAHVRVGYKNFTLFANYGLTPFFEKDKGPEVYPLTVGLSVLSF